MSNMRVNGKATIADAAVAGLNYDIDWSAQHPGYGPFWNLHIRIDITYADLDLRGWQHGESDDRFMYEPRIGGQLVGPSDVPRETIETELGALVRPRIEQARANLVTRITGEQGEATEREYTQDAAAFTALRSALTNTSAEADRPNGADGAPRAAARPKAGEQDPDAARADAEFKNDVLRDLAFLVRGDFKGITYSASVDAGVLSIELVDRAGRYRTFELTADDLHDGEQGQHE